MDTRPVPVVDDRSRPYWMGARRHELVFLRCQSCGYYIHYPRSVCPRCESRNVAPAAVSGRGVIYSYTVTHHKGAPGFQNRTPYIVALIELDAQDGLRTIGNVLGCTPEDVRIGMAVEVVFEDVSAELTLPQFAIRSSDAC